MTCSFDRVSLEVMRVASARLHNVMYVVNHLNLQHLCRRYLQLFVHR